MAQQEGKRLKTADQAGTTFEGSAKSPSYYAVAAPNSDKNIQNQKERQQLNDRTRQRATARTNAAEAKALQVKQQSYLNFQKNQQLKEKNQLEEAQYVDKSNTKMEGDFLIAETDIQGRAEVAKQQVAGANLQATQTTIKGLTSLSGSFMDYQNEMGKIQEQASLDAQQADFLTGGVDGAIISQGQQAEQTQREIEVAGETAIQEATPDLLEQHDIRTPQAEGRKQNNQTRINTIQMGAGMYGGMSDILNDSSIIIRFPDGSERPITAFETHTELEFAINIARSEYIRRSGGIANLSSAELQILTNQSASAAQQIRSSMGSDMQERMEQERVDVAKQLFQTTVTSSNGNVGNALRELADSYYTSGVYKTRAEATEAAINDAAQFASNMNGGRGDRDLLGQINNTPMRVDKDGNPIAGSEAWTYAGDEINSAQQESWQDDQTQINQDRQEVKDDMFRDLRTIQDEGGTRQDIVDRIEQSALSLEESGDFEGARGLREQASDLLTPGSADVATEMLSVRIINGELTDQTVIDDALTEGKISSTQHQQLSNQLSTKNEESSPSDETATQMGETAAKTTWQQLAADLGISVTTNPDGTTSYGAKVLQPYESGIIRDQIEFDINRALNEAFKTRPELLQPGMESEKQQFILQTLANWRQDNVLAPSGKYYTGDIVNNQPTEQQIGRFQSLAASPSELQVIRWTTNTDLRGRNYWMGIEPGGQVPDYVREDYRPGRGDLVLTKDQTQAAIEAFNQGKITPDLSRTAQALGISPRAFLGQQRGAWQIDTDIVDPVPSPGRAPSSVQLRTSGEQMTPVQGAERLVTMGFPPKGASWLAGNIETESSWYGQRPPWDDVGAPAGGLVSWRAGRLEALEARFGRPVSQITDSEQLTFMINEMRVKYPQAYATFMNPYATDRQLIAASKAYWGYGEEGGRYDNARAIESQL